VKISLKKFKESPRVIDRGTSAHFCVSDQYSIINNMHCEFSYNKMVCHLTVFWNSNFLTVKIYLKLSHLKLALLYWKQKIINYSIKRWFWAFKLIDTPITRWHGANAKNQSSLRCLVASISIHSQPNSRTDKVYY